MTMIAPAPTNISCEIVRNNVVYPKFKAWATDGSPLVGGKLYSYLADTETATPLYTDTDFAIEATNPVILDGNGEALLYSDPSVAYRLKLTDADDVQIWDIAYALPAHSFVPHR